MKTLLQSESLAFNSFNNYYGDLYKSLKRIDNLQCSYDAVGITHQNEKHVIEIKNYKNNYEDTNKLDIIYNDEIIKAKFICNFNKVKKLINLKFDYDKLICSSLFYDNSFSVDIKPYLSDIKMNISFIEEYERNSLSEHLKTFYGTNQGKSCYKQRKKGETGYCIFQENAFSECGFKTQEFKIAFI